MTGLVSIFVTMAVLGCTGTPYIADMGADDIILASGVTVQFTCTGPGLPTWFVNGRYAAESEGTQLDFSEAGRELTAATLTISGNHSCDTFHIHCVVVVRESQLLYQHNISLLFQGTAHLPAPENLHINDSLNSTNIIEWNPPYSAMNNDTIHVDPHITQYTVYITDNHTGDVVKVNVTETHFTYIQGNVHCPVYQVSAWNAGGEGELSEPVQPHTPHRLATGKLDIRTAASHTLQIYLNVTEPCKTRTPEYFIITVMNSGRTVNTTTVPYDHQSGSQVCITIELPQNVDMCSLVVTIRAGNSAGMSLPTEIEVECPTNHSDSISTTISETDATRSVEIPSVVPKVEQGLIGVAVGGAITAAAILVTVVVVIVWTVWKHKRKSKVKNSETNQNTTSHPLPPKTAEASQADYESTQANSENTRTQIPVTGSTTGSDSGAYLVHDSMNS